MSDEDILKAVANELKMYGDFDNIDYLIPQLGQAIENILAKNKELKECLEVTSQYLDNIAYDQITYAIKDLMIRKTLIKEKIEELKQEYKIALEENSTKAFILKCQINILDELLGEEK